MLLVVAVVLQDTHNLVPEQHLKVVMAARAEVEMVADKIPMVRVTLETVLMLLRTLVVVVEVVPLVIPPPLVVAVPVLCSSHILPN
jgi:hypothetical protein